MTREEFELVAEEVFEGLPERFRAAIDNVRIVVEDTEYTSQRKKAGIRRGTMLLGLYEGVPRTRRGADYGVYPVVPDTITLFQRNLESISSTEEELRANIRDTLLHEIGHFFGMSEKEIRQAGY